MRTPEISLVVPCHNERKGLPLFYETVCKELHGSEFECIFIDDGSSDDTWSFLTELTELDSRVRAIRLARNFGHQAAIGAGFSHAKGSAIIPMDADLQDPPALVQELVQEWKRGSDIVFAQRTAREGESFAKTFPPRVFHALMSFLGVRIPRNTGDFALMDRKVVKAILASKETRPFWRGLRCWAGFKTTSVEFSRPKRSIGESNYRVSQSIQLAIDAFFSMSNRFQTTISTVLGGLAILLPLLSTAALLLGRTDIALFALGLGLSAILLAGSLGLAYLVRVLEQVRGRPLWIASEKTGFETKQTESQIFVSSWQESEVQH